MRRQTDRRRRWPALLLLLAMAAPAVGRGASGAPSAGAEAAAEPRLLVFILDAVPFAVAAETVRRNGEAFAGFRGPTALVSSFPATTTVALSGILAPFAVGPSPGYEARFYDWQRNAVRGGGPVAFHNIAFGWKELVDWRLKSLTVRALSSLAPIWAGIRELEQGMAAFLASEKRVFFAYVAMTDTIGHLQGPERQGLIIEALAGILARTHRRYPETPFYTVIMSDHGMADGGPLESVRPALRQAFRAAGWRFRPRLRGPDDLVLAPLGLVSNLELYAARGREAAAAAVAVEVPGIDLCAFPEGDGWRIASARGEARIRRQGGGGEGWSYEALAGDPLDYLPVVERLRRRLEDPDGAWFPDGWWFEASADAYYPDALYRVARGFDLVANPASVLCSLAPGYAFGAPRTVAAARLAIGRLLWSHGALHRDGSLGFLMSDLPGWEPPSTVRFDRALAPFAERFAAEAEGAAEPDRPAAGALPPGRW